MINEPISNWKEMKNKCVVCSMKIDKKNERYVNLRDFNKGKFESECFYHLDCWRNRFTITQEKIQQSANQWMNMLSNIDLSKLGGSDGKGYKKIKFL